MKSTTLKEEDYTRARVPGVGVMGAILETIYQPLTCMLCSRTGGGVFRGGDVKVRLLVIEDLKDIGLPQPGEDFPHVSASYICKNVYFTRALRSRQGKDV